VRPRRPSLGRASRIACLHTLVHVSAHAWRCLICRCAGLRPPACDRLYVMCEHGLSLPAERRVPCMCLQFGLYCVCRNTRQLIQEAGCNKLTRLKLAVRRPFVPSCQHCVCLLFTHSGFSRLPVSLSAVSFRPFKPTSTQPSTHVSYIDRHRRTTRQRSRLSADGSRLSRTRRGTGGTPADMRDPYGVPGYHGPSCRKKELNLRPVHSDTGRRGAS
jgi:hypothetical protein